MIMPYETASENDVSTTDKHFTHWVPGRMADMLQMIFWNAFSRIKVFCFDWYFSDICSKESNWQYVSTGADNDFVWNMCRPVSMC